MYTRFCITKTAYQTRPSFIGIRRVPNPRVVNTSLKAQKHWSRYDQCHPLNTVDLIAHSFYRSRKTVKVLVKNELMISLIVQLYPYIALDIVWHKYSAA